MKPVELKSGAANNVRVVCALTCRSATEADDDARIIAMKTNTTSNENSNQFKGYQAKLTTGEVVWVMNQNNNATLKTTGEKVTALKIKERVQIGWQGWSGGARPAYAYKAPRWVRAEMVVRER